jgi:chromate reductase, NAD(P)H dehydrogenase (quinone)
MRITIIVGTNRPLARSSEIAHYYQNSLQKSGYAASILSLADLPVDFLFSALYEKQGTDALFNTFIEQMQNSDAYIFIIPEYNGSFPGVLKSFIDGLPYPSGLQNKWAALVGLSAGAQGAALALSHFTDILHYLGVEVLPQKVRIPEVHKHFAQGEFNQPLYPQLIDEQLHKLLEKSLHSIKSQTQA